MSTTLSYLAGAMDSDGFFTIRRMTYSVRVVGDSTNPTFSERIGLKQVTPHIPELLARTFGGKVKIQKGQTDNSKPLYVWAVTDTIASAACKSLLPFLMVKKKQAEIIMELRESKESKYRKLSHWFAVENPDWANGKMVTTTEAAKILGYKNKMTVAQAFGNGTILGLPGVKDSHREHPRFPKEFLLIYAAHMEKYQRSLGRVRPPQLIVWRERLWTEIKTLNKIGVNGTHVFSRTGVFTPA